MLRIAVFALLLATVTPTVIGQVTSAYTDLMDTKCKTLELNEDEGGLYKGECKGVAGYKLHVIEGDLRQTVNVVFPDKNIHELRFWEHFGGFSAVGSKAEWRVKSKKPIALIVRLNVSEDPEKPDKQSSYLIVSKITKDTACITEILKPMRSQNAEARRAADRSSGKPCKVPGF